MQRDANDSHGVTLFHMYQSGKSFKRYEIIGTPGDLDGWASDSWFWLPLWSLVSETGPHLGLHTWWGICLGFSLSCPSPCLSILSQINESLKNTKLWNVGQGVERCECIFWWWKYKADKIPSENKLALSLKEDTHRGLKNQQFYTQT